MGNCLKTQLKENVNNDNLRKEDEFIINVVNLSSPTYLTIRKADNSNLPMRIIGDGNFIDGDTQENLGKEVTSIKAYNKILLSSGTYKLFVSGKHFDIDFLEIENSSFVVDVNTFNYFNALKVSSVGNGCFSGDITQYIDTVNVNAEIIQFFNTPILEFELANLQRMTNLRAFQFTSNNVIGTLNDILSMTELRDIIIRYCTGITGDASTLLDANDELVLPHLMKVDFRESGITMSEETKQKLITKNVEVL